MQSRKRADLCISSVSIPLASIYTTGYLLTIFTISMSSIYYGTCCHHLVTRTVLNEFLFPLISLGVLAYDDLGIAGVPGIVDEVCTEEQAH